VASLLGNRVILREPTRQSFRLSWPCIDSDRAREALAKEMEPLKAEASILGAELKRLASLRDGLFDKILSSGISGLIWESNKRNLANKNLYF
jgi:hypothetical protein